MRVWFCLLYFYLNQSLWKGGTAGKEYSKLQNIKRVLVQKKVTFIWQGSYFPKVLYIKEN